jgi:bacterioferritin-associated ferredoxin
VKLVIVISKESPMIICSCRAVNDDKLNTILENGASTVREVVAQFGGVDCGSCCKDIAKRLKARKTQAPREPETK